MPTGCSPRYAAVMFNELMTRLGYDKYVSQGGDWGAFVTEWIAGLYPERLIGFHINMFSHPSPFADFRVIPYQVRFPVVTSLIYIYICEL